MRSCQDCEAGKYSPTEGSECLPCPANSGSPPGSTECKRNAGAYANQEQSQCVECEAGNYKAEIGAASSCRPCDARKGWYCPRGSTSPTGVPCLERYFCRGGSADKQVCRDGEKSRTGQVWCVSCSHGMYSVGGLPCERCPAGMYANVGYSSCKDCPMGKVSISVNYVAGEYIPRGGGERDGEACPCSPAGTFSNRTGAVSALRAAPAARAVLLASSRRWKASLRALIAQLCKGTGARRERSSRCSVLSGTGAPEATLNY
jgi:hypothetical protein